MAQEARLPFSVTTSAFFIFSIFTLLCGRIVATAEVVISDFVIRASFDILRELLVALRLLAQFGSRLIIRLSVPKNLIVCAQDDHCTLVRLQTSLVLRNDVTSL